MDANNTERAITNIFNYNLIHAIVKKIIPSQKTFEETFESMCTQIWLNL